MTSLLQKLMLARQINFREGDISLLGQRVVIFPEETIFVMTKLLVDDQSLVPTVYEDIRKSICKGWAGIIKKNYKFKHRDYLNYLFGISNLSGWGKSKLVSFDHKTYSGKTVADNTPMGVAFKGKTTQSVDHLWRAAAAGSISAVFLEPIDVFEVRCIAKGDKQCELYFKPRRLITDEERKKYKSQVPI